MKLSGRQALVTGAGSGIGAAVARALAGEGARVGLIGRRPDALEEVAAGIGPAAVVLPCDVAQPGALDAAVARLGPVDILVNNAAVIDPIGPMHATDPDAWAAAIDINLTAVFRGIRAVLPGMLAAGGGTVLTVSSGAAHRPAPGWSAYCAAKAGAAMLTRSLHLEYADRGIRAMGLSPGTVATDMQRRIRASGIGPVAQLDWSAHVPPEWPARALVWMCTAAADPHLGEELSLRDDWLRRTLGLI